MIPAYVGLNFCWSALMKVAIVESRLPMVSSSWLSTPRDTCPLSASRKSIVLANVHIRVFITKTFLSSLYWIGFSRHDVIYAPQLGGRLQTMLGPISPPASFSLLALLLSGIQLMASL